MAIELSEYMAQQGTMRTWAEKVVAKIELSEEEKEISKAVNDFAKEVAVSGVGSVALSQFLIKVVEPEVYNEPSEILSMMFRESSVGEFDEIGILQSPKNTLIARESAARTGNVDRSYVDFTIGNRISKHLQIETEIRQSDLRRDGALTIAQLTLFAIDAFNNAKFNIVFNHIMSLIASGRENYFEVTGALTKDAMDKFAGYLEDYGTAPLMIGLSTMLRGIKDMSGYDKFMSEKMKDKLYAASILEMYNGVNIASIKASQKLGNGSPIFPDKLLLGVGGQIGEMVTRGQMRVLQTPDNQNETIALKFTGFEFIFAITNLEKIAKLVSK